MTRPRILFVLSGALDVGGAENQLLLTTRELVRRGFDTQILCLWKRGARAEEAERNGVRVEAIPRFLGEMRGPLAKLGRFTGGWLAVVAKMRVWQPDLVHFVLPHAYVVGGCASLLYPRAIRVMSRRGMNRYLQGRSLAQWQERFLHRRMQSILANSERVADELLDEGVPPDRLGLIYNGIELERFAGLPGRREAREQLQLPAEALIMVKVANLWGYKGHADLLDALAGLDLGREWLLLLVGRDEGAESALRAQSRAQGTASNIRFIGASEQVPTILAAADIGISASHEEGFSNAVAEYLAAGLAVVATDVGGSRVAVGDAGLVVPAGRAPSLREAIVEISDGDRLAKLTVFAKRRAASFGMDRCVDAYEGLYRSLLGGRGMPSEVRYHQADEVSPARSDTQSSGLA